MAEDRREARREEARRSTSGGPVVGGVSEEDRLSGPSHADDATYLGGTAPGSSTERQGPEDALGAGPKRGDYTDKVGPEGYNPTETVPVPDAKAGEATAVVVPQRPRTADQGDAEGQKGGVDTHRAAAAKEAKAAANK